MDVKKPDLTCAFATLDEYAKSFKRFFSDLLLFRNITVESSTRQTKDGIFSLNKIDVVRQLRFYLLTQYLLQYSEQSKITLVFIGCGDAVLEIYVTLHVLQTFAELGYKQPGGFRVILCDLEKPKKWDIIEIIFELARHEFPELQLSWHGDIVTIFSELSIHDNYTNTVFLAFNRSIDIVHLPDGTKIDPQSDLVAQLDIDNYGRFANARYISCSSINPDRSSTKVGVWVYADVLQKFNAETRNTRVNVEELPVPLESCIQCNSEIRGIAWTEKRNPERVFCGKRCQHDFWYSSLK